MKAIILFLLLTAAGTLSAQAPYSDQTLTDLKRLQKAALESDYAYEQTAYMSNNIGPRLSGSKQAARAVEYVAAEMRKQGFEVRLQEIKVPHWVRGEESGEVTEFPGMAKGTVQRIVLTTLGGSVATPKNGTTADIVVVNTFDKLTALGTAGVKGKIVLFNAGFDKRLADSGYGIEAYGQAVAYRSGGASAAARLGAVAVIVRSAGGSQNRLAHTGGVRYADGVEKIPAAAVSNEDADLIAHLATQGKTRVKTRSHPADLSQCN